MRNSTSSSTPKTSTVQDDSVSNNAEKTSAKKLKQARLPFKVIAPVTSHGGSKTTTAPAAVVVETNSLDCRKRKLSYDDSKDDVNVIDANDNVSKENVEILKAATKKKKLSSTVCNNDATSDVVVSLLDDDDDNDESNNNEDVANSSIVRDVNQTDFAIDNLKTTSKDKQKSAGSPYTSIAPKDKYGSAKLHKTKLQIKLPLNSDKKKRRKSKLLQLSLNNTTAEGSHNNSAQELSSDDTEAIAIELNPQKRKKLNTHVDDDDTKKAKTRCDDQEQEVETIALDAESEEKKETEKTTTRRLSGKETVRKTSCKKLSEQKATKTASKKTESKLEPNTESSRQRTASEDNDDVASIKHRGTLDDDEYYEKHKDDKEDLDASILSDNDNEADDETDNLTSKAANISSDIGQNSKSKHKNILESQKGGKNTSFSSKNQTPKQIKLMEQRRKAREEKERRLQDEKIKKQLEKEEKEQTKKREREEKEEQRRKEREEKEELKRKERDEKERKRLAEIEAKNEEKRKKNEAKEEELRKKEEERKRKEQEKEEAELKKKKAAQAFTKFFVAKTPSHALLRHEEDSNTGDDTKLLAFRPFQVKGDMKLAPIVRKMFTAKEKSRLDDLVGCRFDEDHEQDVARRKPLPKSQLYLSELRSGKVLPGKWRRASTESKDDVIIVDELERVGQEIVEDTPAYVREEMRVKFYKFHDNRRPPYYGTWRKKSSVVKPRKPFAQDEKFFDYDVDSDDEWEEEEPGESLEDGSDDDKEKESEDDDYEVDNEWFVPHGHLSDEEMQNEDEFGVGDDNTREAQKAKLQILQQEFVQEMKKKTEKIKPRLIGCIWTDINGNQPPECARILWETFEKKTMIFTEPPLVEEPESDRSPEPSSPTGAINGHADKTTTDKLKPISLSDNMVKDLIRLVHGNNHSKNFLINDYIAYVEKTEQSVKNGDVRKPLKTVVRDKIDEIAEWQAIDATASTMLDVEQANDDATADNTKKKKKGKRRLCWVVKQETLNKMDLSSLELQNSWEYTLPPKFVKSDKDVKTDEAETISTTPAVTEDGAKRKNAVAVSQIAKLRNVLTAEEKATQLLNTPASTNSPSNDESVCADTKSNTTSAFKEKKRVGLLMSVARGQQISTPVKNKLISQFLQQKSKDNSNPSSALTSRRSKPLTSPHVEIGDVVILD